MSGPLLIMFGATFAGSLFFSGLENRLEMWRAFLLAAQQAIGTIVMIFLWEFLRWGWGR